MKKIIAIISSCLVAILLATTITLACTKFTAVSVVGDGAMSIKLYKGESTQALELHEDDEEYKEIVRLQKASLKENPLSSLFQGATGFDYEVENKEYGVSGLGFWVSGFEFGVPGFGFRVWGFGIGGWG